MASIRVYADTSVFGGVFDEEFKAPSRAFFNQVRNGRFHLVTSALVQEEIEPAPVQVRRFFNQVLPAVELIAVSEETLRLRDAYLEAGIISSHWSGDALHVALATVARCSLIVSWNFKHIVHFEKIPLYNAVNVLKGYSNVGIFAPLEVIQI
jgi:predicted nucleic acid-binding protein